ncbi:hypothetical protein DFS34DRAFT_646003 [Phlyctochytrium arcticum]|nr:hypothetical protein DFS34DRAFT_646003 [Phlyctochytrium arcticum]
MLTAALYTINNEYAQVVAQMVMFTQSISDLSDRMLLLALRYRKTFEEVLEDMGYRSPALPAAAAGRITEVEDEQQQELRQLQFPMDKRPKLVDAASDAGIRLVLGLDAEWSCALIKGATNIVATIQLSAADGTLYLFHIRKNKRQQKITLPSDLTKLLEVEPIKFVGVHIKADITRISRAYNVEIPEQRVCELIHFARQRKLGIAGRSLAAMVQQMLGKTLDKDPKLRLSDWERPELTRAQVQYACLDAYAGILCFMYVVENGDAIFDSAGAVKLGGMLNMYSKGRVEAVATGSIVDSRPYTVFETLSELKAKHYLRTVVRNSKVSRQFIRLTEVLVPAYKPHYTSGSIKKLGGEDKSLLEVGNVVLWDDKHIQKPKPPAPLQTLRPSQMDYTIAFTTPSDKERFFDDDTQPCHKSIRAIRGGIFEMSVDKINQSFRETKFSKLDDVTYGETRPTDSNPNTPPVLLDALHAMNRISKYLKKSHEAFHPFMARFRDTLFMVSAGDVELVEEVLRKQGLSDADIEEKKDIEWRFFLKYCQRHTPEPKELEQPLFSKKAWKQFESFLNHVCNGCLSDSDDVDLYYEAGRFENGLPVWRCIGGTIAIEGYHKQKAVRNRVLPNVLGSHYFQHLFDEIQIQISQFSDVSVFPTWPIVYLYRDTGERGGLKSYMEDGLTEINTDLLGEAYRESLPESKLREVMSFRPTASVPMSNIHQSARFFSQQLLGAAATSHPVENAEEKQKFMNELEQFTAASTSMAGEKQKSSFAAWASTSELRVPQLALPFQDRRPTTQHLPLPMDSMRQDDSAENIGGLNGGKEAVGSGEVETFDGERSPLNDKLGGYNAADEPQQGYQDAMDE